MPGWSKNFCGEGVGTTELKTGKRGHEKQEQTMQTHGALLYRFSRFTYSVFRKATNSAFSSSVSPIWKRSL